MPVYARISPLAVDDEARAAVADELAYCKTHTTITPALTWWRPHYGSEAGAETVEHEQDLNGWTDERGVHLVYRAIARHPHDLGALRAFARHELAHVLERKMGALTDPAYLAAHRVPTRGPTVCTDLAQRFAKERPTPAVLKQLAARAAAGAAAGGPVVPGTLGFMSHLPGHRARMAELRRRGGYREESRGGGLIAFVPIAGEGTAQTWWKV